MCWGGAHGERQVAIHRGQGSDVVVPDASHHAAHGVDSVRRLEHNPTAFGAVRGRLQRDLHKTCRTVRPGGGMRQVTRGRPRVRQSPAGPPTPGRKRHTVATASSGSSRPRRPSAQRCVCAAGRPHITHLLRYARHNLQIERDANRDAVNVRVEVVGQSRRAERGPRETHRADQAQRDHLQCPRTNSRASAQRWIQFCCASADARLPSSWERHDAPAGSATAAGRACVARRRARG